MTTRQLTVHNASVTTMTVEVKTLTIGTRQVTQGIFRQLIEEPLIAEDGTLNGVPWGHVTWHPNGCADLDRHWHIVWQAGAGLRRARVDKELHFGEFTCREVNEYLGMWTAAAAHGYIAEAPFSLTDAPHGSTVNFHAKRAWRSRDHDLPVCGIGWQALDVAKAHLNVLWATDRQPEGSYHDKAAAALETALAEFDKENDLTPDNWKARLDEATSEYHAAVRAEAERRQRHRDVRATLAQLPQLFIGG